MEIATTSTEYVKIPVTASVGGEPVNLANPPKIAFITGDGNPAALDWKTAEWDDGAARILVGPVGGDITLAPGSYWAWAKWTAGEETPVYRAGRVKVT